jgi:hypothetical protein
MRFRVCSPFSSVVNGWSINLRPGGTLRWKVEDRRLGREGRVMWKFNTSKVVASAYVN